MWLFDFNWREDWWNSYLWSNIQQRLKPLQEEKLGIVKKRLWIDEISRPDISDCDIHDTESVYRFLARENLDCAFHCEPDTPTARVEELCDIILWNISSGKHIHIIPHENTESAAREKWWSDMFGYFEVWIRNIPQVESHTSIAINRFKSFFLQIPWYLHQ